MQIIHLKRFQYVNNKWIKSQKVVDFPYKNFDPTAFLASIPQETILRHAELRSFKSRSILNTIDAADDEIFDNDSLTYSLPRDVQCEAAQQDNENSSKSTHSKNFGTERRKSSLFVSNRERLESTSLTKTPVLDDNFVDYHQHKLKPGEDPFDLKYRLYAVVVSRNQFLNLCNLWIPKLHLTFNIFRVIPV